MSEKTFAQHLKGKMDECGPTKDKKEYLILIFKYYITEYLIHTKTVSGSNKDELESDALNEAKRTLVDQFFNVQGISEYQYSLKQYEEIFDQTIQGILTLAEHNHKGEDKVVHDQNLLINPDAYIHEGGLYLPKGMEKT